MNDLENDDAEISAFVDRSEGQKMHSKPGPEKREITRSDKISCRVTEEERQRSLDYCQKHGISEAKLLRASYLATITETPINELGKFVETLVKPLNELNLPTHQQTAIKAKLTDTLQKSSAIFLLILLGCSSVTGAIRYYSGYHPGEIVTLEKGQVAVYDGGEGFTIRPAEDGEHGL